MATEEEDDQGTRNTVWKKDLRRRCGQQDTSTAGGRWRLQHRTELKDGDEWGLCGLSSTGCYTTTTTTTVIIIIKILLLLLFVPSVVKIPRVKS